MNYRVKHGPQESVPEGMFDDSVDLVVWGHEHDCRIIPEPVAGKQYFITQPGSSVATSLADGESLEKYALRTACFCMHINIHWHSTDTWPC
jgi:double-strand break repair protein MRE11